MLRTIETDSDRLFLAPAEYVDSDHPAVQAAARALCNDCVSEAGKAQAIYRFVREILYHAADFADLESYRASHVLEAGYGYCGAKASLFAALCRAEGIAARLCFADVTNHIATHRSKAKMGSNLYAWHGYNEVRVDGRWLKVSPTFNSSLCEKLGVAPLEFDGKSDALLQAYDRDGKTFLSYDKVHGIFHDVPAKFLAMEMPRLYPEMCAAIRAGDVPLPEDFQYRGLQ
jgi:transglutaminase-like putative cysteine protease